MTGSAAASQKSSQPVGEPESPGPDERTDDNVAIDVQATSDAQRALEGDRAQKGSPAADGQAGLSGERALEAGRAPDGQCINHNIAANL